MKTESQETNKNELSESIALPAWVPRARSLSESTPRVATGELQRPLRSSDSMPRIATADLVRPRWAAR